MTINLVFQACSKYIELDYAFMCERVALRLFITQHVSINNQVLSSRHIFTKPMSKTALSYFQNKPCLLSRHSWREGISSSRNQQLRSNWSGKVTGKKWRNKDGNSCKPAYISGDTLEDEGDPIATDSSQDGNSWQQGNFSYG